MTTRINKTQLRKLVKEEVGKLLKEWDEDDMENTPLHSPSPRDVSIGEIIYSFKELYGKDAPDSFLDRLDKMTDDKLFMLSTSMQKELERKDSEHNKKYGSYSRF